MDIWGLLVIRVLVWNILDLSLFVKMKFKKIKIKELLSFKYVYNRIGKN